MENFTFKNSPYFPSNPQKLHKLVPKPKSKVSTTSTGANLITKTAVLDSKKKLQHRNQ